MRYVIAATVLLAASPAFAVCSIHNDTGEQLTIQSGNVSNQRVGSHTSTSINAGAIVMKSDSGLAATGSCKDGSSIEVELKGGALVIVPK